MTQRCADLFKSTHSNRARLLAPTALAGALLLRNVAFAGAQATISADVMLEQAATAMAELDSFSFELTTLEGETVFLEEITLKNVSGAVLRPNTFTAAAEFDLIIATLDLTIISANGKLWFTDPFGDGDTYQEIDLADMGEFDPTVVINPDRLLIPALSIVQSATIAGTEQLEDGTETTRIDGTVNLADVVSGSGTPTPDELGFTFPEEVPFSVWIDDDSLVHRIEVTGPILPGEADSIIRRVDLFGFNEPVDIQLPN